LDQSIVDLLDHDEVHRRPHIIRTEAGDLLMPHEDEGAALHRLSILAGGSRVDWRNPILGEQREECRSGDAGGGSELDELPSGGWTCLAEHFREIERATHACSSFWY
jgi:hypothetical protein